MEKIDVAELKSVCSNLSKLSNIVNNNVAQKLW